MRPRDYGLSPWFPSAPAQAAALRRAEGCEANQTSGRSTVAFPARRGGQPAFAMVLGTPQGEQLLIGNAVCGTIKRPSPSARRPSAGVMPGRWGGLLGGKDPAGRYLPRVSQRGEFGDLLRVVASAPGLPLQRLQRSCLLEPFLVLGCLLPPLIGRAGADEARAASQCANGSAGKLGFALIKDSASRRSRRTTGFANKLDHRGTSLVHRGTSSAVPTGALSASAILWSA